MRKKLVSLFFVAFLSVGLVGCGGAAIGEACDTAGEQSNCEDGALCTNESGTAKTCQKSCTSDEDCAANESCNGVTGTNLKTCQGS